MRKEYTFIDLFSGCGGLSEGFYDQGFEALTHVEYDKFSCETLRARMKHYGYHEKDISVIEQDIKHKNILKMIKDEVNDSKVDVLVGGPPCQSFSSLGRAKDENSMKDDPRNFLFESYERILNHLNPKVFVFENVMGLLSAKLKDKKTIDIIISKLSRNYNIVCDPAKIVLDSCEYGVPQTRKRVFLIRIHKNLELNPMLIINNIKKTHYAPKSTSEEKENKLKYITVKDAIFDLPAILPGEGEKHIKHHIKHRNPFLKKIRTDKNSDLFDHVARNHNDVDRQRYKEMSKNKWTFSQLLANRPDLNHKKKRVFNNSYVVQFWDQPSRTIIAHLYKDGNQFIHPDYKQERTLTVREAARLQSFPDDFYFAGSRTQQYKQIGNAVPPIMSKAIAKSIKHFLDKIKYV